MIVFVLARVSITFLIDKSCRIISFFCLINDFYPLKMFIYAHEKLNAAKSFLFLLFRILNDKFGLQ